MSSPARATIALALLVHVAAACSDPLRPPEVKAPETGPNTAPAVYAGTYLVPFPVSQVALRAHVQDAEDNVVGYAWRKTSGPDSHVIEAPGAMVTSVKGLEPGLYRFELVATDIGGLTGRDTAIVFVYDRRIEGRTELVLEGLSWQCPMGCSLPMPDVLEYLAGSVNIRVFVRPADAATWTEAVPMNEWIVGNAQYVWNIHKRGISVYSDDSAGRADVKIVHASRQDVGEAALPAGVYELAAPIASFDAGWGIDLAGHRYEAVLTLEGNPDEAGRLGTFADLQLLNPAGEALAPPRSGTVMRRAGVQGRTVLELVDSHFTFGLFVSAVTPDGELLTGTFGMGGHISGPFTAARTSAARNSAPRVHAGSYMVALPASHVMLRADVQDAEGDVVSYSWRRASGPTLPVFDSPDAPETSVTGLAAGMYQFELVARDSGGLTGRDTAAVFVYTRTAGGEKELVLAALPWICPMGCSLLVPDVREFLSGSDSIRVYVMTSHDMSWVEVSLSGATAVAEYVGSIVDGGISVYSDHADGVADLKIVTRGGQE